MDLSYRQFLNPDFSPESRVWVYQSSCEFNDEESGSVKDLISEFIHQWQSHGIPVVGAGYLFFNRFIILMADEKATGVSGCSTDSSVRMIKEIEKKFGVDMFDRKALAFILNDKITVLPVDDLQKAFDGHLLNGDTLYFNNLVQTKEELGNKWIQPVKDSWLAKKISLTRSVS